MIDLYTWSTPNGRKVSIMLEETGLPYHVHSVNIGADEQFEPDFVKISPDSKIPAIVDHDNGLSLMESGAILMYLARKTGQFLPEEGQPGYWEVMQWLMYQMGNVGPFCGQTHHFVRFNRGKCEYAEQRYLNINRRIYQVLDTRLAEHEFLAGSAYSIADIATWPWISRFEWQTMDLNEYPHLRRWYIDLAERPAVVRGYHVPVPQAGVPMPAEPEGASEESA